MYSPLQTGRVSAKRIPVALKRWCHRTCAGGGGRGAGYRRRRRRRRCRRRYHLAPSVVVAYSRLAEAGSRPLRCHMTPHSPAPPPSRPAPLPQRQLHRRRPLCGFHHPVLAPKGLWGSHHRQTAPEECVISIRFISNGENLTKLVSLNFYLNTSGMCMKSSANTRTGMRAVRTWWSPSVGLLRGLCCVGFGLGGSGGLGGS